MSHIKRIKISNFKAIGEFEADFKGCTAILTAANDKGKTSFLRGIPDRIRFIRPDVMVKDGETAGKGEMELTTGECFVWDFDVNGEDKLTYITEKGVPASVTTALGKKFFPSLFDIDKFLQSSPTEQLKQLQKIVGIDFTEIDARHLSNYNDRTEKNRIAEIYHVKLSKMIRVDYVAPLNLTELLAKKEAERNRLNALYVSNKNANDATRAKYNADCENIRQDVTKFNAIQSYLKAKINSCNELLNALRNNEYEGHEVAEWISELGEPLPQKVASDLFPKEPEYPTEKPSDTELQKLDAEILAASETNTAAKAYTDYVAFKKEVEAAKATAAEADELVKNIEGERKKMVESANFPEGVSINASGITVDGLPLDRNQISTSKLYTTALRIAAMNLGEVKTLYFDASFLDKNSLSAIEKWAHENELQLLIERPDFDGGEIRYELIENN